MTELLQWIISNPVLAFILVLYTINVLAVMYSLDKMETLSKVKYPDKVRHYINLFDIEMITLWLLTFSLAFVY